MFIVIVQLTLSLCFLVYNGKLSTHYLSSIHRSHRMKIKTENIMSFGTTADKRRFLQQTRDQTNFWNSESRKVILIDKTDW